MNKPISYTNKAITLMCFDTESVRDMSKFGFARRVKFS